jgi:hypothetical protein
MSQANERVLPRLIVLAGVLALLPSMASAQWKAKDTEWLT